MLCILRHTFGFQRAQATLPGAQLCEWTGLHMSQVSRDIRKLEARGLISVVYGNGYSITVDETQMRLISVGIVSDPACG